MAPPIRRRRRLAWELALQLVALIGVTALVFAPGQTLSLEFLPLPLLIWAALRFDLGIVAWELAGFAVVVILLSSTGHGPFGFDFERGEVSALGLGAVLQAFVLASTLMALPLAISIEQRRRLLQRMSSSEKLTSATLDTTAAMILVTDLYGEVVRVNGATTALTGFAETELVGKEIWDLPFAPPGSTGYPAGLPDESRRPGQPRDRRRDESGDKRRVMWNTSYVRDERERPTYVVITGTDLTAERTAAGLTRHLLEAAITTAMIGIDPHGRITPLQRRRREPARATTRRTWSARRSSTCSTPTRSPSAAGGATGEAAFQRLVAGHRERRRDPAAGLDLDRRRRAAPHGVDDAEHRRRHVRGAVRLPVRRPRRHRGPRQPGDADRGPGEGAARRPADEGPRRGEERVRLDGQPRAAHAGDQHRRLHRDARGRLARRPGTRAAAAAGEHRPQRPAADPALRRPADPQRHRLRRHPWERNAVDLAAILVGAEDALRAQLAGRDLDIVVMSTDAPIPVLGDRGPARAGR